jgi:hypothetical protein
MSLVTTDWTSWRAQRSPNRATTCSLSIPRGSMIRRPALNARKSSLAPGAASSVRPAAAPLARRVRQALDAAEVVDEAVAGLEAESPQHAHVGLHPPHLRALLGRPLLGPFQRLVDQLDGRDLQRLGLRGDGHRAAVLRARNRRHAGRASGRAPPDPAVAGLRQEHRPLLDLPRDVSCRRGVTTPPPGQWFTRTSACGPTWAAAR